MESFAPEDRTTRRPPADLVALAALSAEWINYDVQRLADNLIGAVLKAVQPDFVALRMRDPSGATAITIARTAAQPFELEESDRILAAISPLLDGNGPGFVTSIPEPFGRGTSQMVIVPIGLDGESGNFAVGSQESGFPDGEHRLLLSACVNQAAMVLQHRRAERALHKSDERCRRYFELGLIGMAITSPTKGCLEVNDELCRILGFDREELLQKTWEEMTYPDDRAADIFEYERVIAGEIDGYTMDKRWVRKDRRVIDTTISVSCLRRDDGSVDFFVALLQDVTERKRAEKSLRQSEKLFRGTFENAAVGIVHAGTDGQLLRVNQTFCTYLGYTAAELLDKTLADITHPDDVSTNLEQYGRLMRGEFPSFSLGQRYMRGDGSPVWMDVTVSRQSDEDGTPDYAIAIIVNASDRKRLEAELRRAKESAEFANRAKDQFIATVSHELRAPLTAILLWSQMLEGRIMEPGEEAEAVRAIRASAQAQQQLIEDLLDVSRILGGEMRLNLERTDLTFAVQAAMDIVKPLALAKNIHIEFTPDPGAGQVLADASRMQQVFLNLLNNAVKFTPDGGRVSVQLRRVSDVAEIQVSDTGQGISAAFLPHLFQRFWQADSGRAQRHGGLGLGLAIARELVELHNGTIRVESPGRGLGATFKVELPVTDTWIDFVDGSPLSAQPGWRFVPSPLLKDVRALIVEDDPAAREVIQYLLEQCQADVTAVAKASDALRLVAEPLPQNRFNVLLSDIGMPEMNGLEFMREIRTMERRSGHTPPIPAIALTAYARDLDRVEALAAGFNKHLTKPVVAETLVAIVAECVGRSNALNANRR